MPGNVEQGDTKATKVTQGTWTRDRGWHSSPEEMMKAAADAANCFRYLVATKPREVLQRKLRGCFSSPHRHVIVAGTWVCMIEKTKPTQQAYEYELNCYAGGPPARGARD